VHIQMRAGAAPFACAIGRDVAGFLLSEEDVRCFRSITINKGEMGS
jgi:hypothetical protein